MSLLVFPRMPPILTFPRRPGEGMEIRDGAFVPSPCRRAKVRKGVSPTPTVSRPFPYDLDGVRPYLVTMVLDTHPSYPSTRTYVLKLHRDARPELGRVFGRLENVATGEQLAFASSAELLAALARDVRIDVDA
jgi:hypothetical protein